MEFRLPSQAGAKTVLRGDDHLWITDPDTGEVHASLAFQAQRPPRSP